MLQVHHGKQLYESQMTSSEGAPFFLNQPIK